MTLAFLMQKPTAKESSECVVRGIPGILYIISDSLRQVFEGTSWRVFSKTNADASGMGCSVL
jgi:hypothetical protein